MRYRNIVRCHDLPLEDETLAMIEGMKIFDENELDSIPSLWPLPEELLVVRRTKEDGEHLWFLQNLLGEAMRLDSTFPEADLSVVDPLTGTAVFRGNAFPDNFVLPHGKALLLVKDRDGRETAFPDSVFAPRGPEIPLHLRTMPAAALGDLAKQGFAGHTGIFVYQAEFEGSARILELAMTGGVAEVELNGSFAGICWGSDSLSIAGLVRAGSNELVIRFANTAGSRYGKQDAPFGIETVKIFK